MPAHEPNKAELAFFDAIVDDAPVEKTAVDLEPETADLLGVPTVSPSILDQLEAETETEPEAEPEAEPEVEAEPEIREPKPIEYLQETPPPPPEGLEVGELDREDAEPEGEPAPEPALPTRATHGKLFNDKRAHPLQLLDVLTMRYRTDWAEWEPDTIWWSIRRDFGPIGELTRNKIQALTMAVSTDVPWLDWDVFENCGLAWNDIIPIFGSFQPLTPMQAAFTVQLLRDIRPDEKFSGEVRAYLAAVLEEHGWVYAPEEWFASAQELIDRKEWLVGFKVEVEGAWEKLRAVNAEDIDWEEDSQLSIHLLKLMVVQRYLRERAELRQEIPRIDSFATMATASVPE